MSDVFNTLYKIDVTPKVKQKNGLSYLPWSSAWAEVKKIYPSATFRVIEQNGENDGNSRPWHDDGRTGWVKVEVTIDDITMCETLAIMDFKNQSIPAEKISSTDANKSIKRCLVKCLALFGLGTFLYEGEDVPEDVSKSNELKANIKELLDKKTVTQKGKEKCAEYCKAAEKKAFPELEDDAITGNYKNIDDVDILSNLKKQLMSVRVK